MASAFKRTLGSGAPLDLTSAEDAMEATNTRNYSQRPEEIPAVPRVLVVEDDALLCWALGQTLEAQHCDVMETRSAAEARQAVEQVDDPFDVILLDLRLPDSDDLSLLEALHARAPRTRIVVMTAFGTREVTAGALASGAALVVAKPFDMRDIATIVAPTN
jgi:DNA-binding NtrC family response regulator